MPKRVAPLTAAEVKSLFGKGKPWRHADGAGLYLVVTGPKRAWWMLRYIAPPGSKRVGAQREMGLGAADPEGKIGHSLADARERANEHRRHLRDGIDPLDHRDDLAALAQRAVDARRSFRDCAEAFLAEKSAEWRNAKHRAQWSATLGSYAYPVLGAMPVAAIAMEDVKRVLSPIWTVKPETAARVRGRIEAVLDYAAVHGWREGANPARWKGNLQLAGLASRAKVAPVEHHPALAWQNIGAFMGDLRAQRSTSARALEFLILTGARTGEVLGAEWSEIDLTAAVWTVPAGRMKAGREHRVPLSDAALAVLLHMAPLRHEDGDGYLFPGQGQGNPLSSMAMLKLLGRMGRRDITPHGFRSTFRDWAGETTAHPGDVVEMALAHMVANKVEAAYRRGDLFQKRRVLMDDWAGYCGNAPAEVVALQAEAVAASVAG
jgi:integrase